MSSVSRRAGGLGSTSTATAEHAGRGVGERLRAWLDDTLWGPETAARLMVVQIGLAGLIGLRIALGSYAQLSDAPEAITDPVPLLFFLKQIPPVPVIVALQVIGVVAAAAAIYAIVRAHSPKVLRWGFLVAWLAYLVLSGLRGSRGKVLHNDLLLIWASAPFVLAPLAADWKDRISRRAYGWPIRVATVLVALIYFFAGYHKLRRTGIDWAIGDNMRYVMLWGPSVGQSYWEGLARWTGENIWAARASGVFILGYEVTFPLVLVFHRLKPLYAAGAVFLHTTTYLVLGLDYWAWAITVPLLLINWPQVPETIPKLLRRVPYRGSARSSFRGGAT